MRVPGLNILSGLLLAAGLALPAHADGVEDFYKDRMVTLITGYSSGGGLISMPAWSPTISAATSPGSRGSSCRTCPEPAACGPPTTSTTWLPRTAP